MEPVGLDRTGRYLNLVCFYNVGRKRSLLDLIEAGEIGSWLILIT